MWRDFTFGGPMGGSNRIIRAGAGGLLGGSDEGLVERKGPRRGSTPTSIERWATEAFVPAFRAAA